MSNPNLLADYLNAKAAFETRAEKLFNMEWYSGSPYVWYFSDVTPNMDGTVSICARPGPDPHENEYELACNPVLFECSEDELAATFALHPPRRRVYRY